MGSVVFLLSRREFSLFTASPLISCMLFAHNCVRLLCFGIHILQLLRTNLLSSRLNRMYGLPRCRMYIDGEEDAEGSLPKHMLTPGGMVKDVLESQHPYANNVDK